MKTTLYLPNEIKRAIEAEAARRSSSEAEVIRDALRSALPSAAPRPRRGLYSGREPIASRAEELLRGFGE